MTRGSSFPIRGAAPALLLALAALLLPRDGVAGFRAEAPSSPVAAATVADLAFIAGRWEGRHDGAVADEIWMPPRGDSMAGSFRYVPAEGRAQLVMMIIHRDENGIHLRFRDFSPDFVDLTPAPQAFRLVALAPGRAEFARTTGDAPLRRLIYERIDMRHLDITLVFDGAAADRERAVFHMTRAPAGTRPPVP